MKLDSAGTLYPATRTRSWNATFRFAFLLKEDVNPALLKQAVDALYDRFPWLYTQLENGFFWSYLRPIPRNKNTGETSVLVCEENDYPCRKTRLFHTDEPMFRVLYYKNRLAVETFHAACDGGAALEYIKTLTAKYLQLNGVAIENGGELLDWDVDPSEGELQNSYHAVYRKNASPAPKKVVSYQHRPPQMRGYFKLIHAIIPVADIKAKSKSYGISITEYLVAVMFLALQRIPLDRKQRHHPLTVRVPVSLRGIFGSESQRNFSMFTHISLQPTPIRRTLDAIIEALRGKLQEGITEERMRAELCANTGLLEKLPVRIVPYLLKRQVVKRSGYFSELTSTTVITNLGIVKLPKSMQEHILRPEVILCSTPFRRLQTAVISDGNIINFTFSGDSKDTSIAKEFIRALSEEGIRVRVETNCQGEEDRP